MTNEIAVLGQLGLEEPQVDRPDLPQTSDEPPHYIVQEQVPPQNSGFLPHTGDLQQIGLLMIGLFCLSLFLVFKSRKNSSVNAEV